MRDDDMMDQLLRKALAADAPQLSPAFDARVMRRVRPRRLTSMGRMVIAIYIVVASATAVWLMRDLPPASIAAGIAASALVAGCASAYGRRFVTSQG